MCRRSSERAHRVARPQAGTNLIRIRWSGDNCYIRSPDLDWNRVEGNWKQLKGKVKEKWGNLTDDDLTAINGQRDQLEGKIHQRYGLAKDQVRKDVDDWYNAQSW